MREQGLDGQTYITASDIRDQDGYDDVTPDLLRTWVHDGRLRIVTRGELAAAFGYDQPPKPGDPARAAGPSGPENVYRWADIVRAETAPRLAGVGRPRGRAARGR